MRHTIDLALTPQQLAEAFCELDDDAQAKFFVACAELAKCWPRTKANLGPDWQWWKIGRHLKECECSTIGACDMVKAIAEGASQ